MKIKKKDTKQLYWQPNLGKKYYYETINVKNTTGIISLIIWTEVTKPVIIPYPFKDTLIIDNNYKWFQFSLENQNYWLTAMYDDKDNFIQIYIDVTLENNFENLNNPYFFDLFTDIVLTAEGNICIVDEDELDKAYKENIITSEEYNLAKYITKILFDFVISNTDKLIEYCSIKMQELSQKINK